MIRLYMDVHVDIRITRALRENGCDVLTAQEDGTRQWPDVDLLDRATSLDRLFFTQDKDFLAEGSRRQHEGIPFSGILFASQRNVTDRLADCIASLRLIVEAGRPEEFANRVEYLPYR